MSVLNKESLEEESTLEQKGNRSKLPQETAEPMDIGYSPQLPALKTIDVTKYLSAYNTPVESKDETEVWETSWHSLLVVGLPQSQ